MTNNHQHNNSGSGSSSDSRSTDQALQALQGAGAGAGVGADETETVHYGPRDITQMSREDVFRDVSRSLPTNDYGLPKFIYRADLIPENLFFLDREDQAEILAMASIDISYAEGFPTFKNGSALWSQMEFEPDDAYRAFQAYLNQADRIGIRRIEALKNDPESAPYIASHLDQESLTSLHTYYFWSPRSKAHDLFQQAAAAKLRERRILGIQEQHFLESERLLGQIHGYFNTVDEETGNPVWIDEMTPKVALDFLDKLVKIQRISVGLPAHGLSDAEKEGLSRNASVEVTLKQIARMGVDPDAGKSQNSGAGLEMLLADPETAALAQQLIVRVNTGSGE